MEKTTKTEATTQKAYALLCHFLKLIPIHILANYPSL